MIHKNLCSRKFPAIWYWPLVRFDCGLLISYNINKQLLVNVVRFDCGLLISYNINKQLLVNVVSRLIDEVFIG